MDEKQQAAINELFGVVANIVRAQNPDLAAKLLENRDLFVSVQQDPPPEDDNKTNKTGTEGN